MGGEGVCVMCMGWEGLCWGCIDGMIRTRASILGARCDGVSDGCDAMCMNGIYR